jgi:hypothetical protein
VNTGLFAVKLVELVIIKGSEASELALVPTAFFAFTFAVYEPAVKLLTVAEVLTTVCTKFVNSLFDESKMCTM